MRDPPVPFTKNSRIRTESQKSNNILTLDRFSNMKGNKSRSDPEKDWALRTRGQVGWAPSFPGFQIDPGRFCNESKTSEALEMMG